MAFYQVTKFYDYEGEDHEGFYATEQEAEVKAEEMRNGTSAWIYVYTCDVDASGGYRTVLHKRLGRF